MYETKRMCKNMCIPLPDRKFVITFLRPIINLQIIDSYMNIKYLYILDGHQSSLIARHS